MFAHSRCFSGWLLLLCLSFGSDVTDQAEIDSTEGNNTTIASLRFAMCFSGGFRSFAATAWSLEQHVLQPTVRDGAFVDLFFHMWSDGDALSAASEHTMRALPGFVKAVVEKRVDMKVLTDTFYEQESKGQMWHMNKMSDQWRFFRSQWRKVWLAFQLAKNSGKHYAAYVRARPDYFFMLPHSLAAFHISFSQSQLASSEYFAAPECDPGVRIQDQWLMATRRAMELYATPVLPEEPNCCEPFLEARFQNLGASVIDVSPRACPHSSRNLYDHNAPGQTETPPRNHKLKSRLGTAPGPVYIVKAIGFITYDTMVHPTLLAKRLVCVSRTHLEARYQNIVKSALAEEVPGACIPRNKIPPWAFEGRRDSPGKKLPVPDQTPCFRFNEGPPSSLLTNQSLLDIFTDFLERIPEKKREQHDDWPRYSYLEYKACKKKKKRNEKSDDVQGSAKPEL